MQLTVSHNSDKVVRWAPHPNVELVSIRGTGFVDFLVTEGYSS